MVVRTLKETVVRGMDMSLQDGLNLEKILISRLTAKRDRGAAPR
jgi:hypothetical protein